MLRALSLPLALLAAAQSANGTAADAPALATEPDPPLIESVDRALRAGRYDEAEALLARTTQPGDRNLADMLHLLQAELAIARGRPDKATEALAAIADDDHLPSCRVALARGWHAVHAGQSAAAAPILSAATKTCPEDAQLWRWRARAERDTGQLADALLSLRSANARAPANTAITNDLAVALMEMGSVDEAIQRLDAAMKTHASDAALIRNRAFAGGMKGETPVRLAGEGAPAFSDRLEAAGNGAMKAGNPRLARALYAEAMIQNPNHSAELSRRYRLIESIK